MTAVQLNAALFRELHLIMADEDKMERAIRSLHRINSRPKASPKEKKISLNSLPELPEALSSLQGFASHTEEEIANDPRLAYILSK